MQMNFQELLDTYAQDPNERNLTAVENFLAANNYPETDAHEIELVCPIREDQAEVFEEILEIIH
tara:strand:+ start:1479 stop:1670 length:192 start_codon:yes stop_codon:yes gene_type:complete